MEMLWTDFVNSECFDWRGKGRSEDRLEKPEWLERFKTEYGFETSALPDAGELVQLKQLRTELRRLSALLVERNADEAPKGSALSAEVLEPLNRLLAASPVVRSIKISEEGCKMTALPIHRGWLSVAAEIAASFGNTLAEGDSSRIRICDNPDCQWVFYDDTRNRSKKFCDDKMCGNLMKVRRFRSRHKHEGHD